MYVMYVFSLSHTLTLLPTKKEASFVRRLLGLRPRLPSTHLYSTYIYRWISDNNNNKPVKNRSAFRVPISVRLARGRTRKLSDSCAFSRLFTTLWSKEKEKGKHKNPGSLHTYFGLVRASMISFLVPSQIHSRDSYCVTISLTRNTLSLSLSHFPP